MCGSVKTLAFSIGMYVGTPLGSDDARQLVALEREKSIARHQPGGSPVGSKGECEGEGRYRGWNGGRKKKVDERDGWSRLG